VKDSYIFGQFVHFKTSNIYLIQFNVNVLIENLTAFLIYFAGSLKSGQLTPEIQTLLFPINLFTIMLTPPVLMASDVYKANIS